jgi:hypothetical protein
VKLIKRAVALTALLLLLPSIFSSACTAKAQILSINIEFVSSPPAYVNQPFEIAATVSGGTPPYTYQWYTKWFPPWKPGMDPEQYRASSGSEIAVPSATSATFWFTPTVEGIYWIGVGVSDSAGNSVSRFPSIQPLQLTVNNPVQKTTPTPETPNFTLAPTETPFLPPRNPPHLSPIDYLIDLIIAVAIILPLVTAFLLYRRHRKNTK